MSRCLRSNGHATQARHGLLLILSCTTTLLAAGSPPKLNVLDVEIEPLAVGKNVVNLKVSNPSDKDLVFALHIYAKSPNFGMWGYGTGEVHYRPIDAGKTKDFRFLFKLMGAPTSSTYVRLRFYTLEQKDDWKFPGFDEMRELRGDELAVRNLTSGKELELLAPEGTPVLTVLTQVQQSLAREDYARAWRMFSTDWRTLEFESAEGFAKALQGDTRWQVLNWARSEFAELRPEQLLRRSDGFTVRCKRLDDTWTIELKNESGDLRIDRVVGVPQALSWASCWRRLQEDMRKRSTQHYDIYYWPRSSAAQDINHIAEQRERAYSQIVQLISYTGGRRLELYLFEDGRSKWTHTGHQGAGLTLGHRLAEVYNAQSRMDPYHEPTHALMHGRGAPPAALNEGFAVYATERLSKGPALRFLGGGELSVFQRARQIRSDGDWMSLGDLLWLNEIGSEESRATVSYPLAGAFVKFLVEKYGIEKFMQAYNTLRGTNHRPTHEENIRQLESIYSTTLVDLERAWVAAIGT